MSYWKYSISLLAFFFFCLLPYQIFSQQAFPGSVGFGSVTRGAYELYETTGDPNDLPHILYVNTLDGGIFSSSDSSGTLQWALSRDFPRIILFQVGGVIDWSDIENLSHRFDINYPYISLYGQSAPSPGITITGGFPHLNGIHNV